MNTKKQKQYNSQQLLAEVFTRYDLGSVEERGVIIKEISSQLNDRGACPEQLKQYLSDPSQARPVAL